MKATSHQLTTPGLVEAGLEPFGRRLAEEDGAVEVDHRVDVDADPERVGGAAGEVVGAEDEHDRQPVDDDLEDLPRVAADRVAGQRAADPGDHQLALDRHPVGGAPGDQRDEVGRQRPAPHLGPVGETEIGSRFGPHLCELGRAQDTNLCFVTAV